MPACTIASTIDSRVLTLRLDGPLFFADAERFKETVYDMIEAASEPPEAIALDADSISLTDTDGADALIDLATELHDKRSLRFAVARVQPPVWQLWERAGLATRRVRRTMLRHGARGGRRLGRFRVQVTRCDA